MLVTTSRGLQSFLNRANPGAAARAMTLILTAIERIPDAPDRGRRIGKGALRQIVVRFGRSGYIVRYTPLPETQDILITRVWHGREARL